MWVDKLAYENIACSSLIKRTSNFLMDFPIFTFDIHEVVLSLAIFTRLYSTSIKMLKGTIGGDTGFNKPLVLPLPD